MKQDVNHYIGKRFNSVTVLRQDFTSAHGNSNSWVFLCDCGNEFSDRPNRVLSGHRKSCGCLKGKASLTHGCNGDEFYPTWYSMMKRCYNPSHHKYPQYGGRGITVCDDWHDPAVFISWARSTVGHKTKNLTIDRKDNNLGYSPDNCRWSTPKEQCNNRRSSSYVVYRGVETTLANLAHEHGLDTDVVRSRVKQLGWDLEKALNTPVKHHKK